MATRTRSRATKRLVVALDGPASSGKSSVGAAAATQLGMRFVDTGLFYRALTALALREGVATDDADGLAALVDRVSLGDGGGGRMTRVLLDEVDATEEARGPIVDAAVSAVASVPEVRARLLERQRDLARDGAIVVAGRDIGTVVLPDADVKLFLDASVDERAARRIDERGLDPTGPDADEVRTQLRQRDELDSMRKVAPLRAADDAVHVRTDGNSFAETVEIVTAEIARVMLDPPTKPTRPRTRAAKAAVVTPEPAPEPPAEAAEPGPVLGNAEPELVPAVAEPEPAAEPAVRVARTRSTAAPRPRRSAVLETAMRLDNDKSMLVRMAALVSRIGARGIAAVDVQGLDNIPRTGPVILASNHISNGDPVILGAWITPALRGRRIHWLGKQELFSWPVFGLIAANGGVHPVDRDAADVEAFRLATRILEQGFVLLVFPEGTRSPDGRLQEAKDGVAMLALRTGAAIVPIGVNNSDAVWKKGQRLPLPFPRRSVNVRIGMPFTVADVVPALADRRAAKRLATRAIMGRIAELLDTRHRGVYADAIREALPPER